MHIYLARVARYKRYICTCLTFISLLLNAGFGFDRKWSYKLSYDNKTQKHI